MTIIFNGVNELGDSSLNDAATFECAPLITSVKQVFIVSQIWIMVPILPIRVLNNQSTFRGRMELTLHLVINLLDIVLYVVTNEDNHG